MHVRIKFGDDLNCRSYLAAEGSTIGTIIRDPRNQAALGYGDHVEAHVGGQVQPADTPAFDGITVSVHNKRTEKQA